MLADLYRKMIAASLCLLVLIGTAVGDGKTGDTVQDFAEQLLREFRAQVEVFRKAKTLTEEKATKYLKTFNLVCNSTTGPGSPIQDVFFNNMKYNNVCITDGSCLKQVSDDLSVSMWCIGMYDELECRSSTREERGLACCKNASFCNGALNVTVKPAKPSTSGWHLVVVYVIVGIFVVSALLGAVFAVVLIKRPQHRYSFWLFKQLCHRRIARVAEAEGLLSQGSGKRSADILDRITNAFSESTNIDPTTLESGLSSGSGSGLPDLIQRTVARQVDLAVSVGRGRFGEVWAANWRGESVAVKIFNSYDEQSWKREVEVYETTMLRHPNILTYISSDSRDAGSVLQLWLITEYHGYGSLFDYLEKNVVTAKVAAKMIRSIASGLSYLHLEVENSIQTLFKPGVAHRDMKSKNVLVKSDLTCAIADFGLAVKSFHDRLEVPENAKCGTARYLAPELLTDRPLETYEQYKRADVYSLGLIIWEVLRRCEINDRVSEYQVPYYDYLPREPSLEEMKQCVLVEKRRPLFCDYWDGCLFAGEVSRVMSECWAQKPTSRLTAANARIALDRLIVYFGWHVPIPE